MSAGPLERWGARAAGWGVAGLLVLLAVVCLEGGEPELVGIAAAAAGLVVHVARGTRVPRANP